MRLRSHLITLAACCVSPFFVIASSASAAVVLHDAFNGSDIGAGDDGQSINGGFSGFQSNQTPNLSSGIEAGGVVTLTGNSHTRDAGYGLISDTGFSANQQLTITWDIADAFLQNQADADDKDLDKVVMGITRGQNFGNLKTGLEISLENGGAEFAIRLKDNNVTYIADTYVSGVASGWDGQSAVSVTAVLDPLGYSVSVSTMGSLVTGLWADQTRAVSYLDQLTNLTTQESYVFINHFGSNVAQFGENPADPHFTAVNSITVLDEIPLPLPNAMGMFAIGLGLMAAGMRRRRPNQCDYQTK